MVANVGNSIRPAQTQSTQSTQKASTGQAGWANANAQVVNQLNPQGAAQSNYQNGAYNCAGAVAATAARMLGTQQGTSDADLITQLSAGRTTSAGTTPSDLIGMLQDVGARVDQPMADDYQDSDLSSALSKGDKVAAQVGVYNQSTGDFDPHFVMVSGQDQNGNYQIKDPMKGQYTVTPDQLRQAVDNAPGAGGVLIPFGPQATGGRSAGAVPTQGLAPTAVATNAFRTDNSALQGVDTAWHADSFEATGAGLSTDSRHNDALFGQTIDSHMGAATATAPSVSGNMKPQDYANFVLNKLSDRDPLVKSDGKALLRQLEGSDNANDRQALNLIMNQVGNQPGIGQRAGYGGYGG